MKFPAVASMSPIPLVRFLTYARAIVCSQTAPTALELVLVVNLPALGEVRQERREFSDRLAKTAYPLVGV